MTASCSRNLTQECDIPDVSFQQLRTNVRNWQLHKIT